MQTEIVEHAAAIAAAERSTRRHEYRDGVMEMTTGVYLLGVGFLFALGARYSRPPLWFPPAFLAAMLVPHLLNYLERRIRARLSQPRVGYVKPRVVPLTNAGAAWLVGGFAMAVLVLPLLASLVLMYTEIRDEMLSRLMRPTLIVTMVAMLCFMSVMEARAIRLPRTYVYCAVTLIASLVACGLPLGAAGPLVAGALGAARGLGGLVTFTRMLRLPVDTNTSA